MHACLEQDTLSAFKLQVTVTVIQYSITNYADQLGMSTTLAQHAGTPSMAFTLAFPPERHSSQHPLL